MVLAGLAGPLLITRWTVVQSGGPEHVSLFAKVGATLVALLLAVVIVELLVARAKSGSLLRKVWAGMLSSAIVLSGLAVPGTLFGAARLARTDAADNSPSAQRTDAALDMGRAPNSNPTAVTNAERPSQESIEVAAY